MQDSKPLRVGIPHGVHYPYIKIYYPRAHAAVGQLAGRPEATAAADVGVGVELCHDRWEGMRVWCGVLYFCGTYMPP